MTLKAIIFGSIGTLVETSDLQRRAFNQAFAEAGLDWNWDIDAYKRLLTKSGGHLRIKDYATQCGIEVDTNQLHRRKTEVFDALMTKQSISLRPGVSSVINYAIDREIKLAFATTTSTANIDALFFALDVQLKRDDFNFIGNNSMVPNPKPSPDIYQKVLSALQLAAQDCIAIEDTATSMKSALAANLRCIAFPGDFALSNDFSGAVLITNDLSPENLSGVRD